MNRQTSTTYYKQLNMYTKSPPLAWWQKHCDDDDDDEGRINFSVALSPKRLQGHITISLNSEVT